MRQKNKKAVSEVVSYVLLVIVALVLSALVYAFLQLYVPKEKPECKNGINIVIENADCVNNKVSLTLQNRGLFSIDRVFIKMGKAESRVRENLLSMPYNFPPEGELKPSQSASLEIEITSEKIKDIQRDETAETLSGKYIIEIQPAHFTKESRDPNSLALCDLITQEVNC